MGGFCQQYQHAICKMCIVYSGFRVQDFTDNIYEWAKVSNAHTKSQNKKYIRLSWSKRNIIKSVNFLHATFAFIVVLFNFSRFESNDWMHFQRTDIHPPPERRQNSAEWNETKDVNCSLGFQPSLANDPFPSRWSQFSPLWMENSDGSDQHQSQYFPKLSIESVEKSPGTKT